MMAIAGPHHSSSMIRQNVFHDYFRVTLGTAPMGKAALAQEGAEVADWL